MPSGGELIYRLVDVIETHNRLGENALWNVRENRLWWTDIQNSRLYRFDPASGALENFATPERLCSFAFERDGGLIAAFASGLALYRRQNGHRRWLYRQDPGDVPVRCNDGRCDRDGRFWIGTMAEPDGMPALGRLLRLDRDGSIAVLEDSLGIVNAICTSPDGGKLYFADSRAQTIFVCALDRTTGNLSDRRVFAKTHGNARPDGATVDADGCVWNAEWDGGRIIRYTPNGRAAETIALPVDRPTCLAFGGPRMNLLFVTTACDGLSKDAIMAQPLAGNVFVFETDATGLPDAEFVLEKTR
jgi:L-arabinonolactonase